MGRLLHHSLLHQRGQTLLLHTSFAHESLFQVLDSGAIDSRAARAPCNLAAILVKYAVFSVGVVYP